MSWSFEQLGFIARWTIWPLLQPLESKLSELHQLVMEFRNSGGLQGPSVQSSTSTQEINFSTVEADDNFFSRTDVASELIDAQLLYRAVGGERIIRVVVSAVDPGVDVEVEIQRTDFTRGAATSFPSPIIVALGVGSPPVVVLLDQPLAEGECLVASALGSWAGIRVDGTLFIESAK